LYTFFRIHSKNGVTVTEWPSHLVGNLRVRVWTPTTPGCLKQRIFPTMITFERRPDRKIGSPFFQKLRNCHFLIKRCVKYWHFFCLFENHAWKPYFFGAILPKNPAFYQSPFFHSNIAWNTFFSALGYFKFFSKKASFSILFYGEEDLFPVRSLDLITKSIFCTNKISFPALNWSKLLNFGNCCNISFCLS